MGCPYYPPIAWTTDLRFGRKIPLVQSLFDQLAKFLHLSKCYEFKPQFLNKLVQIKKSTSYYYDEKVIKTKGRSGVGWQKQFKTKWTTHRDQHLDDLHDLWALANNICPLHDQLLKMVGSMVGENGREYCSTCNTFSWFISKGIGPESAPWVFRSQDGSQLIAPNE